MRRFLSRLTNFLLYPFRLIARITRGLSRRVSSISENIDNFFSEEPEDTPLPDTFAKTIENPEGIFFHINILRKHIFRGLIFLVVTTAISFAYTEKIIDWMAQPIGGITHLNPIDITEPLSVFMRVALLSGFTLALPYIAFELWLFIAPGVSRRTRINGLIGIPAVVIFFVGGMAFAYYMMLPTAIPFLLNFLGMTPQIRPASYIGFVTTMLFWVGMAFEFPLIIFILSSIGLVKPAMLREHWKLAIVIIAVIAAMITPTVDPINMSLVMGPLIVLYFFSIFLSSIAVSRKKPVTET